MLPLVVAGSKCGDSSSCVATRVLLQNLQVTELLSAFFGPSQKLSTPRLLTFSVSGLPCMLAMLHGCLERPEASKTGCSSLVAVAVVSRVGSQVPGSMRS